MANIGTQSDHLHTPPTISHESGIVGTALLHARLRLKFVPDQPSGPLFLS